MNIRLIFASPEQDADLLYWSRIFSVDEFLAFEVEDRRYAVINSLEIDEFRRNSGFDEVLLPHDLTQQEYPSITDLIRCVCEKFPHHKLVLPKNFPGYLVLKLQEQKIPFSIEEGLFLPERSIKSDREIVEIRKACAIITHAFAHVRNILVNAKIIDGILYYNDKVLTSEWVRSEIERICFEGGMIAKETIVAGGKSAAFPHNRGEGPLRANEFMVVDIFPRLIKSGYFGDMTRTFLKGQPSPEQVKMYNAVRDIQKQAIAAIKPGKDAKEIHDCNVAMFKDLGYETTNSTGFFHGTGHGVGLEIHEEPSIGGQHHVLQVGEVFTIEPGLYYPDFGGVRIEDVIVVRENGVELLSNCPYDWII